MPYLRKFLSPISHAPSCEKACASVFLRQQVISKWISLQLHLKEFIRCVSETERVNFLEGIREMQIKSKIKNHEKKRS